MSSHTCTLYFTVKADKAMMCYILTKPLYQLYVLPSSLGQEKAATDGESSREAVKYYNAAG